MCVEVSFPLVAFMVAAAMLFVALGMLIAMRVR